MRKAGGRVLVGPLSLIAAALLAGCGQGGGGGGASAQLTPAQACSSFCPASATKIYSGSSIEHAMSPEGKRYNELGTAFVYRDKLVPGCSCNGKDAFGLVTVDVASDPTVRAGDIIATADGLKPAGRKCSASRNGLLKTVGSGSSRS